MCLKELFRSGTGLPVFTTYFQFKIKLSVKYNTKTIYTKYAKVLNC